MNAPVINKMARWARIELAMPREEFNRLTPVEFQGLVKLWLLKEKRLQIYLGQLRHTMAVSMGATLEDGSKVPFDFFYPSYKKKRKRRQKDPIAALIAIVGKDRVVDLRKNPDGK